MPPVCCAATTAGTSCPCSPRPRASTGEQALLDKLDYLIDELGRCRDAMAASGRYSDPGYLCAFPEDQFAKLERYVQYPSIWAPWYTCHKILAGLLDAHRLTGNQRALELAHGLGRWAQGPAEPDYTRAAPADVGALHRRRVRRDERKSSAELAVLTGDPAMLDAARYFDNEPLLAACAGEPGRAGRQAREPAHPPVPRLSEDVRGDRRDCSTSLPPSNFWAMVVPHRIYSHGGVGQLEVFRARD